MLDTRRPSTGVVLFAWAGAGLFGLSLIYFLYRYLTGFGADASRDAANTILQPVLIDAGLFSAFALHHSIAARPPLKQRLQRFVPPVLERSLYTWTASTLFILVCAWWQPVPGELYQLTGVAAALGYLVQATGTVLTALGSARLDVLDLAGARQVLDARHGTTRAHVPLETHGLYGFVRHPVYFAWLLFVFGAPHMTMTRLVFAVVSSTYLAIAIPFEERSLIHTFGPDYRAYQKQVRWRLIPGVY